MKRQLRRLKHSFHDYIAFTQSEFRGTMLLLTLVMLLVGVRWVLPYFNLGKYNDVNAVTIDNADSLLALARKLETTTPYSRSNEQSVTIPELEIEHSLFAFDPNTASFPDLLKLGFDRKTANNIVKYRDKGGKFKRASDLYKIYGANPELINTLVPYVTLPESAVATMNYNNDGEGTTKSIYKPVAAPVSKAKQVVDLNTADSSVLVNVNGIGPTFASRIVKFRNRLGGYVSKEQLKEVYGLTPEHYETIAPHVTVNESNVKRININKATLDELKTHIYFKYNVAKAIVAYRDQHGAFKSKEDLKQVALVDDAFYSKIGPYIVLE